MRLLRGSERQVVDSPGGSIGTLLGRDVPEDRFGIVDDCIFMVVDGPLRLNGRVSEDGGIGPSGSVSLLPGADGRAVERLLPYHWR